MATDVPSRWSRIRERKLVDPQVREQYQRTRRSVSSIRQVLQVVDAERQRAGLTKAELAQRIGTSPAAIRRLFTSESANPTLRTVVDLLDALDLEVALRPKPRTRAVPGPRSARSGTQAARAH